jgi:hypothetical protein
MMMLIQTVMELSSLGYFQLTLKIIYVDLGCMEYMWYDVDHKQIQVEG